MASSARSVAAAVANRSRSRRRLVSTRSWRPVSGSTSHSSPTSGRSCSRGSRISTATTSCRPASSISSMPPVPRPAEVADHEDQGAAGGQPPGPGQGLPQRGGPATLELRLAADGGQHPQQPGPALPRRDRHRLGVAEGDQPEPVAVPGADVADGQGDPLGHVGLAPVGGAEAHRRRGVQDQPADQGPLGDLVADVDVAGPGGDVPVDPADVVARLVEADLGQLGPDADGAGAVVPGEHGLDPAAHDHVEGAQQRLRGRAGAGPVGGAGDAEGIVHAGCSLARSMRGGGMAFRTAVSKAVGGDLFGQGLVGQDQAVAQDVAGEFLDVLGQGVAAAPEHGQGSGGGDQVDRPSRAGAIGDVARRGRGGCSWPGGGWRRTGRRRTRRPAGRHRHWRCGPGGPGAGPGRGFW